MSWTDSQENIQECGNPNFKPIPVSPIASTQKTHSQYSVMYFNCQKLSERERERERAGGQHIEERGPGD